MPGSIIANTGDKIKDIHPIIIEGVGHAAISNIEAFSGDNPAFTNFGVSYDFLTVKGNKKCTVSMFGCRMRNYVADEPLTVLNKNAIRFIPTTLITQIQMSNKSLFRFIILR